MILWIHGVVPASGASCIQHHGTVGITRSVEVSGTSRDACGVNQLTGDASPLRAPRTPLALGLPRGHWDDAKGRGPTRLRRAPPPHRTRRTCRSPAAPSRRTSMMWRDARSAAAAHSTRGSISASSSRPLTSGPQSAVTRTPGKRPADPRTPSCSWSTRATPIAMLHVTAEAEQPATWDSDSSASRPLQRMFLRGTPYDAVEQQRHVGGIKDHLLSDYQHHLQSTSLFGPRWAVSSGLTPHPGPVRRCWRPSALQPTQVPTARTERRSTSSVGHGLACSAHPPQRPRTL